MADGQNLAIANVILKDVYGDINEQINNATPALDGIKSTARNITQVGGLGVKFVAHVGRNTGIGARGEDEDLPEAGNQQYVDGQTGLKSFYGSVRLTGQVMAQASQNYQTFADVTSEEIERIRDDIAKDQNRQIFGDGTGTLAKVATANTVAAATLALDNVKYLHVGMRVDVLLAASLGNATPTPAHTAGYVTINAINKTTKVVTFDRNLAASVTVGSAIVRSNSTSSTQVNNWKKEWSGFGALVNDTTTLHGINPATTPAWAAHTKDISVSNVAQQITEEDMIGMVTDIAEDGDKPDVIWTDHGSWNGYWKALEDRRRYVNKVDLEGGNRALGFATEFGDLPFKADFDAPVGKMWFINQKKINLNTNRGWEWIDEDGSKWKQVPRRDAFIAYLRSYSEISTYRRNTHGVISGIAPGI
jgi:hypothetical protein